MLCSECAREEFGPDWHRGREEESTEFVFACARCGAEERLPRPPTDTSYLLCRRCYRGEEIPDPDRIGGAVIDRKGGVRKKKRQN